MHRSWCRSRSKTNLNVRSLGWLQPKWQNYREWRKPQHSKDMPKAHATPNWSACETHRAQLLAMSSTTSMSSDEAISTSSESSQQHMSTAEKPSASTSGSEHSEQFAERSLYCLALVDSETGHAVRPVTDEEAAELARALSAPANRPKAQANATSASATPTSRQNSVSRPKPGGPCDNCGVMGT